MDGAQARDRYSSFLRCMMQRWMGFGCYEALCFSLSETVLDADLGGSIKKWKRASCELQLDMGWSILKKKRQVPTQASCSYLEEEWS